MKQFEATWSETPRPGWSSEAAGVGERGVGAGGLGDEACLILLLFFYIFVQPMTTSRSRG